MGVFTTDSRSFFVLLGICFLTDAFFLVSVSFFIPSIFLYTFK
ncbi:hypothetical protein D931_03342 [Enterococcus faecium 13.SD.W.09]|nr:hypothetical protein D931_03342 [Enterococcus faecium 13.SD.W.09]